MRAPHVLRLAEIDERRFITACRHGLVHLTWHRVTVRFGRDEFRRLARLLARATEPPPGWLRDGEMQVTWSHQGGDVQVGPFRLALSPDEFQAFGRVVQEAVEQLDKILDSGIWDEDASEDVPPSILERFRQHSFSDN
jgi:hypothetical protein